MQILFFIDRIHEDPPIGEAVEYEGKIWLVAPLLGQTAPATTGPVRLIRVDDQPKFSAVSPGYCLLNTPIPKAVILGESSSGYEIQILADRSILGDQRAH